MNTLWQWAARVVLGAIVNMMVAQSHVQFSLDAVAGVAHTSRRLQATEETYRPPDLFI